MIPECRHRGVEVKLGGYQCACPCFVQPASGLTVTGEYCETKCIYVDTVDGKKTKTPRRRFASLPPGLALHYLIHKATGEQPTTLTEKVDPNDPKPPCQCQSRMQQMDLWGWRGCWEQRELIMTWLAENAKKILGYDVEPNLQALARLALKTAKERKAVIDEEMMERFGKLIDENEEVAEVFRLLMAELEPMLPEAMELMQQETPQ